jgi:predicted PurR-regulated permease PerM
MNSTPSSFLPKWSARQVITATLFVVAVSLAFWLLFRFRIVILILFIAMVLGTALRPMVDWFVGRGMSRAYSLSLMYLVLALAFTGLLLLVVPIVIDQSFELAVSIPGIYQDFRSMLFESPSIFLRNIGFNLPSDLGLMVNNNSIEGQSLDAVSRFLNLTNTLSSGLLAVGAIFLLTSFWILESDRSIRSLLFYLPLSMRQEGLELYRAIEKRVGAFVRGQLILCAIIGAMALTAYLLIGLPNALVLAIIAGIFEAVPVIGPALGAVPALLVAFSISPTMVLWVLVSTIVIQVSENYLFVPKVMGASVGVHPMVTLLVLATFTSLLGLPGALLAIPTAAVFQLILDRFLLSKEQVDERIPEGRDLNSALRYEVQDLIGDIHKQLRKKEKRSDGESDQIEDAIESLAIELDLLLNPEVREKDV